MDLPPFRFLAHRSGIEEYLRGIRDEPAVALDLEADSLHNYREKVCLVQVSTGQGHAVLDPLASREALQELGPLLGDPGTEKILHGGDYDVRLLKKDFGFAVVNVFDTMIAAQFTGRSQFGLAALLLEFFGVTLDKHHQRADWSARPLSDEMLAYATLDTAYLIPLRARLGEELVRLGRVEWVREECELLVAVEPAPARRPWCLDVKGASRLKGQPLAVLQELVEVRDTAARERDVPPFKVFSNQVLLEWAAKPPTSRHDVVETPGANKGVLGRWASAVLEAVARARALTPDQWPSPTPSAFEPLTGAQERRLKRLKRVREDSAARLSLAPGLLVNSATLERLAREDPDEVFASLPGALKRWQRSVLEEPLVRALRGDDPPA
ncbi:MAG: ribonuclease D [Deltaproteobacteria bacterium]|nr:ribonuclease D [Deltaproteobacteria bacterium]